MRKLLPIILTALLLFVGCTAEKTAPKPTEPLNTDTLIGVWTGDADETQTITQTFNSYIEETIGPIFSFHDLHHTVSLSFSEDGEMALSCDETTTEEMLHQLEEQSSECLYAYWQEQTAKHGTTVEERLAVHGISWEEYLHSVVTVTAYSYLYNYHIPSLLEDPVPTQPAEALDYGLIGMDGVSTSYKGWTEHYHTEEDRIYLDTPTYEQYYYETVKNGGHLDVLNQHIVRKDHAERDYTVEYHLDKSSDIPLQ